MIRNVDEWRDFLHKTLGKEWVDGLLQEELLNDWEEDRASLLAVLRQCVEAMERCIRDSLEPDKVYIHASRGIAAAKAKLEEA
jgi:hypothetical protein